VTQSVVCRRMLTRWSAWRVVDEFALALDIPGLAATDMDGCIQTATFLMPDVTRIEVYAGGVPDVVYRLTTDDDGLTGWEAVDVRPVGDQG
jgi:hypothetical protein